MANVERQLVAFRLPLNDLQLLDALVAKFRADGDGVVEYTRTDLLRVAIRRLGKQELPDTRPVDAAPASA